MAERYTHGMDVRRVRSIADRLAQAQRDLTAAQAASDSAARLLKEHWDGEDSASFAGRWPHLSGILETQAGTIKGLVQDLRAQADEQELASGGRDSDGDGVPDSRDRDTDNDGTPNRQDTDDDNDGTPDAEDKNRPGLNADVPLGPQDRDGDGYDDRTKEELDDDGDGVPDVRDTDDDNDGTPDADDPDHPSESPREWEKTWEKEWVDNSPQHKADPRVDVSMELGSVEKELWDATYAEKTFGDEDGTHLTLEALSTEGKAEGSWALDRDGLTTAGTLTAGGYLAKASGAWSHGNTSASGTAYVGAEANAKGGLSLGMDGVRANAGVDAFIGGKAEADINHDFGVVDAGIGGEISYGIGAHAEADAEFSADRVGVSVDIGATLGIGGGIELDIGFDPPW